MEKILTEAITDKAVEQSTVGDMRPLFFVIVILLLIIIFSIRMAIKTSKVKSHKQRKNISFKS